MTGSTIINNAGVIKNLRCKCHVGVTNVTVLRGGDVSGRLNRRRSRWENFRVMTPFATRGNRRVHITQKDGRGKTTHSGILVTQTALVLGRDMIHLLTHRNHTVMTGGAVIGHTQVVIRCPGKAVECKMTIGTVTIRRQMICTHTGTDRAIVA